MSFIILSDASVNLDKAMREKYDIESIPFLMTCKRDGKEYVADSDWSNISSANFYGRMRKGDQFQTTQVQVVTYEEYYEKFLSQGKDILCISVSSGISGSFSASVLAKDNIMSKYPNRKIVCIDSLRASGGQGLLAMKSSIMRAEGKSIGEVAAWLEKNRHMVHQFGTVDDLIYLKRAGRVSGFAHTMAKILNIRPIVGVNRKGENQSLSKVKGRKKSLSTMIDLAKENVINPEEQIVFIVHADCLEDAESLKKDIMTAIPFKDCYINVVTTAVGASTGPSMMAVYFFGKEITK